MFCMGSNSCVWCEGPSLRQDPAEASRETSARRGQGTSRKPPRVRGGAGRTHRGQHGLDRSGVAGRKPNRRRGLSVEGEVPQPGRSGEEPKQTSSADLIRQCQAQGETSREGRKRSPCPPMPTAPPPELPRCLSRTATRCTPIRTWLLASSCADVDRRPALRAEGRGPGPHQLRSA